MGGRALLWVAMVVSCACGNDSRYGDGDDEGGETNALACQARTVMLEHCTSCHDDPPRKGAPMPLTSLDHLRGQSAIHLGVTYADRSLTRIHRADRPMPPASMPSVPVEQIAILETWVGAGMPACDEDPGALPETHPNMIPQDELFTCQPGTAGASPSRVRRLDAAEWRFDLPNFTDLQNVSLAKVNPLTANTADRYSTYSSDETVDDVVLDLLLEPGLLGGTVGDEIVNHLNALRAEEPRLDCFFTQAAPAAACVSDFATVLLQRNVLFRAPTPAEVTRLADVATTILAMTPALAERRAVMSQVANTAWLSTGALFRSELGGAPEADGRRKLTNDELATALAYALADRAPGAPRQGFNGGGRVYTADLAGHLADIAAAGADGSIQDPAVLDALVRQYAAGTDPDRLQLGPEVGNLESRRTHGIYWTSDKIRGFFREWLDYGDFPTQFKDQPGKTSQFQMLRNESIYSPLTTSYNQLQIGYYAVSRPGTPGSYKESLMVDQLDDVIARTVYEDLDVLKTLLTTTRFHVAATYPEGFNSVKETHRPYNLTEPVPFDTREGRWITLPATERSGVLTHPAWLATHGGNFDDDPSAVHRGKWIRENLLCQFVPPLSAVQVQAMVGPSDAAMTARSRLETATADELCQGCHRLMNPLGLAFETYNHAGFVRAIDHDGSAPNGTMMLEDTPDPGLDGAYANAIELNAALADSAFVKRCFVRQAFRYYMGRAETRADACALTQMEAAYDQQGSFVDMLSALVQSDAFRYVEGN